MLLSNEEVIDQFLCHYTCGPSHALADEVLWQYVRYSYSYYFPCKWYTSVIRAEVLFLSKQCRTQEVRAGG